MKRICVIPVAAFLLAASTGCPDYSHLRAEPDYDNMSDTGEESSIPNNENELEQ